MKKLKFYAVIVLFVIIINIFSGVILAIENTNETNTIMINQTDENNVIPEKEDTKNTVNDTNTTNVVENELNNSIVDNKDSANNDNNIINNTIDNDTIVENTDDDVVEEEIKKNDGIMLLSDDEQSTLSVQYKTHVQNVGWQNYVKDGETAGTSGQSLRLEGINIKLLNSEENLNIKYQVHIQNVGWQSWKKNGDMAGTSGQSLRLEAIRICLEDSEDYSIMYRVHVQNVGWQNWKTDGEIAGTSGQSLRLEAIQIKIVSKQKKGKICLEAPSNGTTYYGISSINVKGWKMANVSNTMIKAYLDEAEVASSAITYYNRTDVTNTILDYGTATQNPKAGFKFSIDTTEVSSGNHTIKIVLYAGNTVLTTINSTFKIDRDLHVSYRSHVQNIGWQGYVFDGQTSGTSGKSYRVEALNISLKNAPSDAKILYRTHVQNIGWQSWKSNGEAAGTSGQSLRVEAIEIKLQNMDDYTVEYQVHVQNVGWTGWYIDGETAGTVGRGLRVEAIRIRLVPKYKRQYKGIDVSQFNGSINWGYVKNEGIDFAFIRVGFRGYGQAGNFAEDSMFKLNMAAAKNAGIPVGVYFVTQAITEAEAVEEANWVLDKIKGYNLEYPIAIDIEAPGLAKPTDIPRTQNLDKSTRTRLAKIFCQTIQNAGYTPIVYTNVNWATNYLNMSELSQFDTWIAHYTSASAPSYNGNYTIWQYTSLGSVRGILGNVDLNIGYKKY